MKNATTPVAVEYGVVLTAMSVPVAIAAFQFAGLVDRVFASFMPHVTAVATVVGG